MNLKLQEQAQEYYDEVSGKSDRYLELEEEGVNWELGFPKLPHDEFVLLQLKKEMVRLLRHGVIYRDDIEGLVYETLNNWPELEVESLEDFTGRVKPIKKNPNSLIEWGWGGRDPRCEHTQDVIGGSWAGLLTASGSLAHKISKNEHPSPDFGLYADGAWVSLVMGRNEFINWPDMSVPVNTKLACKQIEGAFSRLIRGEHVNVGCVGGHGRTGTILAAIKMLEDSQLGADDAVKLVRADYCHQAVEMPEQEEFLRNFRRGSK